jgi:DNA-binding MarR family transcriptional regulator
VTRIPQSAQRAVSGARGLDSIRLPTVVASASNRTEIVGREAELARLSNAAEGALAGHGSFVLVGGGPGVSHVERYESEVLPRPAELAKSLAMDESTLSRNVARMCDRGWLRLEPGDEDRRSHEIAVTEKGMALLSRLAKSSAPDNRAAGRGRSCRSQVRQKEATYAELTGPPSVPPVRILFIVFSHQTNLDQRTKSFLFRGFTTARKPRPLLPSASPYLG